MWLFHGKTHGKCRSGARLDGKTAVVTGSSSGIGKCTALDFAKRGCRVLMACPDLVEAEDAAEEIRKATAGVEGVGVVVVIHLDLSSFASVRECAETLLKTESQINLLVNNAGIAFHPKATSKDGFELQFAVNYLGHFLLTLLLLPMIMKSAPARIVNVASLTYRSELNARIDQLTEAIQHYAVGALSFKMAVPPEKIGSINFDDINGFRAYNSVRAYSQSKLAIMLFTRELAERLKGTGVTTYCLHPGYVKSSLFRTLDEVFFRGAARMVLFGTVLVGKTPMQGAQTTIYCAVDERVAKDSGFYYRDCSRARITSRASDSALAHRLWMETLAWVAVEDSCPEQH